MDKPDPTNRPQVSLVLNGLRRLLPKPKSRKSAFIQKQIVQLVKKIQLKTSLLAARDCCFILLAFYEFFRYSDLAPIRVENLAFSENEEYVIVHLTKAKNDQFQKGNEVFIAASKSDICPMLALRRYMVSGNLSQQPIAFLFQNISWNKRKKQWMLNGNCISYQACAKAMKLHIIDIGLNPKEYGMNSLRSGGISAAVRAKVSKRPYPTNYQSLLLCMLTMTARRRTVIIESSLI
jgi:hypothetical protein